MSEDIEENKINRNNELQENQTFNPNLLIMSNIKKQLSESLSDEQKEEERTFLTNIGENKEWVKRLEGTPFNFTREGLQFIVLKKDDDGEDDFDIRTISNALIYPIQQQNLISEDRTKSNIKLKAILAPTGEVLQEILVPINQFESGNWMTNSIWSIKVIFCLPIQKSVQINCIKELGKYMETEDIYEYTGWTEIDGKRVFLHTGGAIGIDKQIKVELGDETLNRIRFTEKEFKLKETIKTTLKFRNVAPLKITVPLLSITYMSIFTSIFEELKISTGVFTLVVGPPKSKKTSMVSAICGSFGDFDRNHTHMNFLDGVPSIKKKMSKCKDVLRNN